MIRWGGYFIVDLAVLLGSALRASYRELLGKSFGFWFLVSGFWFVVLVLVFGFWFVVLVLVFIYEGYRKS